MGEMIPPRWFVTKVKRWLREIGYSYCGTCFDAVQLERMSDVRCKACNSKRVKAQFKTEHGKERLKKNVSTYKDTIHGRHRINEYQRWRMAHIKTTQPEKYKAFLKRSAELNRMYYRKRKGADVSPGTN